MQHSPIGGDRRPSATALAAMMLRRKPSNDLWLFLLCQALAVAIVTGILLFTQRIQEAIYLESAKMMAADMVVQSSSPVDAEWLSQAQDAGLGQVQSARLLSMLFSEEQLQLTDIRAVSDGYPLRGELIVAARLGAVGAVTSDLPAPGEVWLDDSTANTLAVAVGDRIEVGERSLLFSRVLVEEPGNALPSFGLSGRALIRMEDIASTELVQPGSRVNYQWMLAGETADLDDFRLWLTRHLSDHQRIETRTEGNERTARTLKKAASFLNLGGAIAVLLAGIAAMMVAARYMAGQRDNVAIMRALGATRSQLLGAYLSQFLGFSLVALLLGYAIGFSLQAAGFYLVRSWFDASAEIAPSAFIAGAVTAMFCLFCFALPTLTALIKVSPMRLLRSMPDTRQQNRGVLWFALGFLLLMYFYSASWQTTLIVYGGIVLLAMLVWVLSGWFIKLIRPLLASGHLRFVRLNTERWMAIALGINAFCRQPQASQLRSAALAMTITLIAVVISLRGALLGEWQAQLPAETPNYFALNISETDVESMRAELQRPGFRSEPMYPVARARLLAINGQSFVDWGVTDAENLARLDRDMVLTEIAELPNDNQVIAGQWHGAQKHAQVSVEQSIAERLNISLGDKLHFSFAGTELLVEVSSIRELNWNSMQPNFYFIVSPPSLTAFPYTYMTSFYVPDGNTELINTLSRRYSTASVIDIGKMVERAKGILTRVSLAVESVAWITMIAGMLVVVASLRATMDARLREQTIARALGGSTRLLKGAMLSELAVTGLIAGVAGILAAAAIVYALGEWVFDMSLVLSPSLAIGLPLAAMALVVGTGFWVLRRVHRQSPLAIWRSG